MESKVTRLNVALESFEGRSVVRLVGELDVSTSAILAAKVATIDGPLCLDCGGLTDSGGFAALVALRRDVESLVLSRVAPELREVLLIMNLGGAIAIVDDIGDLDWT